MDLTTCPDCGLVAEVESRDVWEGTDGPVEHATVRCIGKHRFVLPVASLSSTRYAVEPAWQLPPLVRVRHLR